MGVIFGSFEERKRAFVFFSFQLFLDSWQGRIFFAFGKKYIFIRKRVVSRFSSLCLFDMSESKKIANRLQAVWEIALIVIEDCERKKFLTILPLRF